MPTVAPESTDVEMNESSPPRIAGNKRAAVSSPAITPPGQGTTHPLAPLDTETEDFDTELKPARLADTFEVPPKKNTTSLNSQPLKQLYHVDHIEDSEECIDLLNQQVFDELVSEPKPPTPGEFLAYNFDDDDAYTKATIYTLNGLKLEEGM
jgi:hypothetical protein